MPAVPDHLYGDPGVTEGAGPHLLDASMFWNPTGGVRRYILAKRRWLRGQTDWRHTVATPMPDDSNALAIPSLPLPGSGGSYRLPWRRTDSARLMAGLNPDLIEAADPYRLAWAALDCARALRVPAVAFCHSNLERMAWLAVRGRLGGLAARAARHYAAHLYRQFDLVLAPSQAMVAHLQDWGIPQARHQPLGVDTTVFCPAAPDPSWRVQLGLPSDARVLLYVGRFAPEKALPTLVDAVRRLGAPYWLVAIGAGPLAPRGERVIVLPAVHDDVHLARCYANADVFVHAGAHETFGLSALEAMACGLPVVARAAEGMGELVDAEVGHAVGHHTAMAFAEAIDAVLARDPSPLRIAARKRALAHDWQQVMPVLWARYQRLLSGEPVTHP